MGSCLSSTVCDGGKRGCSVAVTPRRALHRACATAAWCVLGRPPPAHWRTGVAAIELVHTAGEEPANLNRYSGPRGCARSPLRCTGDQATQRHRQHGNVAIPKPLFWSCGLVVVWFLYSWAGLRRQQHHRALQQPERRRPVRFIERRHVGAVGLCTSPLPRRQET